MADVLIIEVAVKESVDNSRVINVGDTYKVVFPFTSLSHAAPLGYRLCIHFLKHDIIVYRKSN